MVTRPSIYDTLYREAQKILSEHDYALYVLTCNSPPAHGENIFFSGASPEGKVARDVSASVLSFVLSVRRRSHAYLLRHGDSRAQERSRGHFASWAIPKGDDEMKVCIRYGESKHLNYRNRKFFPFIGNESGLYRSY